MTATLAAIAILTLLGIPFVLAVDRDAPLGRAVGLGVLYGSGALYLLLLLLAVLHVRWGLVSVGAGVLGCWGAGWFLRARAAVTPRTRPAPQNPRTPAPFIFDLATILTLAGYTLFATLAPLWEWDFWAIWGLKARAFLEVRTIDWRFLERPWNSFVHPDYPLLVPLNYDFAALLGGGWSDRWLVSFCVAWAVALLLVARELARRETTPLAASIVTFALASLAASDFIGLAEGALIAFGGAGVLFVRRAILFDDDVAWRHAAICLGFATCCKNEGLALLVVVIVATAITAKPRNRVTRLWPAVAIAAPWLILRGIHTLPTDIVAGSAASRIGLRLPHAAGIFAALAVHLFQPLFWIGIVVAVIVIPAAARKREAFVLLVTAAQLAIYVVAYFATPNDPQWHIITSWSRLTAQISVPVAFAMIVRCAACRSSTAAVTNSAKPATN